jgi:UDP-N-acetylmuramoyl-tripeptide--D-alanyl-D-alanine ligase
MMNLQELYDIYKKYPSVQTDTRKLKKDDLFFALKGPSFNGNEFASKAIESGAACAVIDEAAFTIPGKTFLVDDVLTALQELALFHRKQLDIPFIAITGSNGKTTTKELIHSVLSSQFRTSTTEGNLNNHIGVPLTILKIRPDAQMAVIEMGANHLGEIASYCRIALPTHGLITNCGKAHLEGFGSEEGVRKGKGELFDHLRANGGTAFVFRDYDYLGEMSRGIPHIFTYGTKDADVAGTAGNTHPFLEVLFSQGIQGRLSTHLVGDYNLPNVLAAAAVGFFFSISPETIMKALAGYEPSNSRSQLITKGSNRIILDAYNANPSSMKLAIENFARANDPHKVLVLGSMAELGPESLEEHRQIVRTIEGHQWQHVLLVGGEFERARHSFHQFPTASGAGEWLKEQGISNAYLLVKGSRSMQMEKILEDL